MRIMGIDPGITRLGLAVVEVDERRKANLIHVEVARTSTNLASHFRLRDAARAIKRVIIDYQPEVVAIERVFAHENLQSVTTTMWAMGVAMATAGEAGLPLAIHTPSEVKAAVTGNGTAGKAQVQEMVRRVLGMDKVLRPADAADAVAIAICHGWRGSGLQGASQDGAVNVSLSGGISARQKLTAAQKIWAEAEAVSRRTGAVDPHRRRQSASLEKRSVKRRTRGQS